MSRLIKLQKKGEDSFRAYSEKDFEKEMGITYLTTLQYENSETQKEIEKQCAKAIKRKLVDRERVWLGALYGKLIDSAEIADVIIRWIDPLIGYGVFATKEIKAWQLIGEYTGIIRKQPCFFKNINDYCFSYPTSTIFLRKHSIDALNSGNETRYINHSDEPNCESVGIFHNSLFHIIIRTIAPIAKGAQLFYDYGNHLSTHPAR
jgi:uncharacterized protein